MGVGWAIIIAAPSPVSMVPVPFEDNREAVNKTTTTKTGEHCSNDGSERGQGERNRKVTVGVSRGMKKKTLNEKRN